MEFKGMGLGLSFFPFFLCFLCRSCFSSIRDDNIDLTMKETGSLNFLVVGDWGRKGNYNQTKVAYQMGRIGEELQVEFIVSTGDNFYEDGLTGVADKSFRESFSDIYTAKSLQKPWYAVLGNHDYRGDVLAQLSPILRGLDHRWNCRRSFTLKRSFAAGSVDLFFVDTTPFVSKYWKHPNKDTYDWRGVAPREAYISRQLKELAEGLKASTATWKIVIGHHTIRSVGHHGDTEELLQQLLPILETYNVDLYINGHDHCLEHIKSVTSDLQFLTSGAGSKSWRGIDKNANMKGLEMYYDGQGFMSLQITSTNIQAAFYDIEGTVIHQVDLYKSLLQKY
ncbi:purple acid phosphatase 3 isoform X1 [Cryptomeria japonica]|uniref:purple acid phosphatase 3 isoform X1 n=1 Tax=Cryptomeria japonica TaxID=3369 RepID=UPI0027DA6641|nr:purple acid phosphatase 3 isoform X1 [Cryptomeria japonica]